MWQLPPNSTFTAPKPNSDVFAPSGGWSTALPPITPWTVNPAPEPSYRSDEGLKKQYGIELAKASNPFEAACTLFEDTSQALWVSINWIKDPVCIASKDIYLKTVAFSQPPLDKEQLAAKVLSLAEETVLNKAGNRVPAIEAKDRIAALKLYSDILGYTGKVEVDASSKSFTHNEMTIKLVRAEVKEKVLAAPKLVGGVK